MKKASTLLRQLLGEGKVDTSHSSLVFEVNGHWRAHLASQILKPLLAGDHCINELLLPMICFPITSLDVHDRMHVCLPPLVVAFH